MNRIFFLFFLFLYNILTLGLILKSSRFNLRFTTIFINLSSHFHFFVSSLSCKLRSFNFLSELQFPCLSRSISFLFYGFPHLRNQRDRNIIFFIVSFFFLLFSFLPISYLRLFFHILSFLFFTIWTFTALIIIWSIFLSSLIGHSVPVLCSLITYLGYIYLLLVFFFF